MFLSGIVGLQVYYFKQLLKLGIIGPSGIVGNCVPLGSKIVELIIFLFYEFCPTIAEEGGAFSLSLNRIELVIALWRICVTLITI